MNIYKYRFLTSTFLHCLLVLLLLFIFQSLLTTDPITKYDDNLLLNGLAGLNSFSDYLDRFFSGEILDIQPIRDLSYLIDMKMKSITSFYTFHLTNLLVWILIVFLFKNILNVLNEDDEEHRWLIWSIVFIYALSPFAMSSVAWIAARKHLLSTFFILWATLIFLKKRKSEFCIKSIGIISLLFLFATLAHPINVLWPVFVFLYSFFDKKILSRRGLLFFLGSISVVMILVNLYYYGNLYVQITGGDGKHDANFGVGDSLLALGRYFYISLIPFDALPVSHFQGSWQNIVGLNLLVIYLYLCYKKSKVDYGIICFVFYFFVPLVPVTYKITRIFCSDTYLINACLGIYISLFLILKKLNFKYIYIPFFAYSAFLFVYSFNYIKVFESSDKIWHYSYEKEPTQMSIVNLAHMMITQKKYSHANILLDQLEIMEPENRFYMKYRSDLIYKDHTISDFDKIRRLEDLNPKVPIIYLELALLYSNRNNPIEFKKNVEALFLDTSAYIRYSYFNNEQFLALVKVGCEKNKIEQECKNLFFKFKEKVFFNKWDKEKYEKMYYDFSKNPGSLFYQEI
jgi:hypothetical protein